jgi:hypothetical protein
MSKQYKIWIAMQRFQDLRSKSRSSQGRSSALRKSLASLSKDWRAKSLFRMEDSGD